MRSHQREWSDDVCATTQPWLRHEIVETVVLLPEGGKSAPLSCTSKSLIFWCSFHATLSSCVVGQHYLSVFTFTSLHLQNMNFCNLIFVFGNLRHVETGYKVKNHISFWFEILHNYTAVLKILKDLRWCIRHHSSIEESAGLNKFGLSAGPQFDSDRTPVK